MVSRKIPRNNRRFDGRPRSYVDSCYAVRWPSEATLLTFKSISGRSVGFVLISAFRAGSGSPSWVHSFDGDTRQDRFVFDKTPQLPKCPRMMASTLSLANRYPVPDTLQIFEGYQSSGVFGLRNQPLGDAMIGIGDESSLLPRELLEVSLRTRCTTPLEIPSQLEILATDLIDGLSTISFAVAIHDYIDDTEVDTESIDGFYLIGLWNIDHDAEIECALDEYKVRLSTEPIHTGFMIISHDDWDDNPAFECQDRYSIDALPRQYTLVIDHGPILLETRLVVLIPFIDLDDLGDGPDCHLCGEPEPFPDIVIDEFLEFHLVGTSFLEGFVGYKITCFIEGFHGGLELPPLLPIGFELDLQCQVHIIHYIFQCINRYRQFLPRLKPWASLAKES